MDSIISPFACVPVTSARKQRQDLGQISDLDAALLLLKHMVPADVAILITSKNSNLNILPS